MILSLDIKIWEWFEKSCILFNNIFLNLSKLADIICKDISKDKVRCAFVNVFARLLSVQNTIEANSKTRLISYLFARAGPLRLSNMQLVIVSF